MTNPPTKVVVGSDEEPVVSGMRREAVLTQSHVIVPSNRPEPDVAPSWVAPVVIAGIVVVGVAAVLFLAMC